MQYLVSVIDDTAGLATPDEMAAIDVFNDRLQAEGHWVFAGGLAVAQHGHRHRQPGRGGGVHRRALRGVEGVPRRLLDHRGRRPRRGAQARRRGVEGLQPEGRGAAVPVSVIDVREAITQAHHEEWARVVAALTRRFGDLDIAEEAAAEAFATAVERWPADGVPPNPGAWLTTTANRKAIDRIRRENKRDDKQKEAQMLYDDDPPEPPGAIDDERLRLIFTCCHPALAMETRVALTLRMVGGLTVPEIARAFLVQETTMGQRITRAKAKIKAARIPYRVPSAEDLPARVSGVLAVLYLVFNEGYLATGPDTDPVRHDLTAEAIRLTRLIRALLPEDGEVAGLLALMLLTEARRTARVSASGELVTLDEQDRGAWDAALIAEGHRLVRERLAAGVAPGRYQILAAINAVHTSARDVRDTDWSQVVALYDQLVRLDPSPIVALNRAIAVAELDGPEVALAAVDRLEDKLAGYHAYHATRADLLRRLGRSQESRAAYDQAIELAGNTAETAYLTRRRDQLARCVRSSPGHRGGGCRAALQRLQRPSRDGGVELRSSRAPAAPARWRAGRPRRPDPRVLLATAQPTSANHRGCRTSRSRRPEGSRAFHREFLRSRPRASSGQAERYGNATAVPGCPGGRRESCFRRLVKWNGGVR